MHLHVLVYPYKVRIENSVLDRLEFITIVICYTTLTSSDRRLTLEFLMLVFIHIIYCLQRCEMRVTHTLIN